MSSLSPPESVREQGRKPPHGGRSGLRAVDTLAGTLSLARRMRWRSLKCRARSPRASPNRPLRDGGATLARWCSLCARLYASLACATRVCASLRAAFASDWIVGLRPARSRLATCTCARVARKYNVSLFAIDGSFRAARTASAKLNAGAAAAVAASFTEAGAADAASGVLYCSNNACATSVSLCGPDSCDATAARPAQPRQRPTASRPAASRMRESDLAA